MATTSCPKCGYAMSETDLDCPRCQRMQQQQRQQPPAAPVAYGPPPPLAAAPAEQNTSGTYGPVPSAVSNLGWCWGGFGLDGIWGIGNKVWISLLALIPVVALGIKIWLGVKGHEMAWRARRFDSFEQYRATMRTWNNWGIGFFVVSILSLPFWLFVVLPVFSAILFPVFAKANVKADQSSCLSNTKQISLAMLSYAQDYDENFPPQIIWEETQTSLNGHCVWDDLISPYVANADVFYCPSRGEELGYGFNSNLAWYSLGRVRSPRDTGMIYEVESNSTKTIYPHNGGMNVSFVDGHSKWLIESEVSKDVVW